METSVIGIDLGATNIRGAVVRGAGNRCPTSSPCESMLMGAWMKCWKIFIP